MFNTVFNYIAGHYDPGFFGVKANNSVFAVFKVFECWGNNVSSQRLGFDGTKVFVGREIHQNLRLNLGELVIHRLGNCGIPKLIQVFARLIFKFGAHFEPVGLDQIKWAQ